MSDTHVFVSHTPVGLKAAFADSVLPVVKHGFTIGAPVEAWDYGQGAEATEASDRDLVGPRWPVQGPHASSFALGVVGPLRDVVILTTAGGSLSRLEKALDDDGSSLIGLLSGLGRVARAARTLWLADTDPAEAVRAVRGGDLDDDLVRRVRATWGDAGWAAAVQAIGGTADPVLHPESALRL